MSARAWLLALPLAVLIWALLLGALLVWGRPALGVMLLTAGVLHAWGLSARAFDGEPVDPRSAALAAALFVGGAWLLAGEWS